MKDSLLIRTDAGAATGMGHVTRCIALAGMLKDIFNITFVSRVIPDDTIQELLSQGFFFRSITSDDELDELIAENIIIVVDVYEFDALVEERLRSKGCFMVCVDDIHERYFAANLIINHAPGIFREAYTVQPLTQFALGPEYALLRPDFLETLDRNHTTDAARSGHLLICFGGMDPRNLTMRALEIAQGFMQLKQITVVVGKLNTNHVLLAELAAKDKRVILKVNINGNEMATIMANADIAVIPASSILLESLGARCRSITGMYVENQKFMYSNSVLLQGVYDAKTFTEKPLRLAIETAIADIHALRPSLIDGQSPMRMRKLFRQIQLSNSIVLRRITPDDKEITYTWAINSAIRRFSFSQHTISEEEHNIWFDAKSNDPCCVYLIAECNKKSIGSIRFDQKGSAYIISYLVDSTFHGDGLGQGLLLRGMQYMAKAFPGQQLLFVGYVLDANIPSCKAFRKLGFVETREGGHQKFEILLS